MGLIRTDFHALQAAIPYGSGYCLDLGGGNAGLKSLLTRRGYRYLNLDIAPGLAGLDILGDAHSLPFRSGAFSLVVSVESLEHFHEPYRAIAEVWRVLQPGGRFVILVPFLTPFHETDLFRYTPYGLRALLHSYEVISVRAPTHVFTILGNFLAVVTTRFRLGMLAGPVRDAFSLFDRLLNRLGFEFQSYANSYLVVATKQCEAAPR